MALGRVEGSSSFAPAYEASHSVHKLLSRRKLFKQLQRAAGMGAALPLVPGLRSDAVTNLPTDIAYIFGEQPVDLLLGAHELNSPLGNEEKDVLDPYKDTGTLESCMWLPETRSIIASHMQQARAENRPFICAVDSMPPYTPVDESALLWPLIPFRDLANPEKYPHDIYFIGAEAQSYYGITTQTIPANDGAAQDQLYAFTDEVVNWYSPYRPDAEQLWESYSNDTLRNNSIEGVIAGALALASLLPTVLTSHVSRRKTIKALTALGAGLGVAGLDVLGEWGKTNGQFGDPLTDAANQNDLPAQKLLTVEGNLATNETGNSGADFAAQVRTAYAFEKCLELERKTIDGHRGNHIAMLYGDYHGTNAPRIATDQEYRLNLIQQFATDLVTKISNVIDTKYTALKPYTEQICATAAMSITYYTVYKINMPWKQTYVDDYETFEPNLRTPVLSGQCQSVKTIVEHVLKNFGFASQQEG